MSGRLEGLFTSSFLLLFLSAGLACKRKPEEVAKAPVPEIRYVLASVALVRARPDPGADAVARWPIGTRLEVKGREGRFIKVDQDGVRGFLFEGLVSETEPKLPDLIARYDASPADALEERRTWAERAAALAPQDEQAVRRLVEILERLGDQKALLRARRGLEAIRLEQVAKAPPPTTSSTTTSPKGPGRACLEASPKRELDVRFGPSKVLQQNSVEEGEEEGRGCPEAGGCFYQLHEVGEVTGPICTGARVLVLSTNVESCVCKCEDTPDAQTQLLRFVELADGWVPVAHREVVPSWALEAIGVSVFSDLSVAISGLRLSAPDELDLGQRRIVRKTEDGLRPDPVRPGPKVTSLDGHELYEAGEGFIIPRADGTATFYRRFVPELEEGFFTENIDFDETRTSSHARTDAHYVYLEPRLEDLGLVSVGRVRETKDELRTFGDPALAEWDERYARYEEATKQYREAYGQARELVSKEVFVAKIPLLLWRDPFGRNHMFIREELVPPEMAEPLVYLYAPKPTGVRLDVGAKVELLAADPPYEAGWSVRTRMDGQLDDLSSGRVVPAIFWEGRSAPLPEPTRGLVVRAEQVRSTLEDVLPKLGLDARERADFIEYWAPRLRSAPYYRLSFLDPELVDRIAPLLVEPRPDVAIRVHMEARPLLRPVAIEAPIFTSRPARKGLVLVEWSGFRYAQPSLQYFARNSPDQCVPRR